MGFFSKLKEGLSKTKNSFNEKMNNVFSNFRKVDEELLEELEEVLIMSDVGVETSLKIIFPFNSSIFKPFPISSFSSIARILFILSNDTCDVWISSIWLNNSFNGEKHCLI